MKRDIYQNTDKHRYDDMLDMEHPTSRTHPRMSVQERAAQFAPFAALTGHEAAISETARRTEVRPELESDYQELLDYRLKLICQKLEEKPEVEISYFVPDERKAGGSIRTIQGRAQELDQQEGILYLEKGQEICIRDIVAIRDI